MRSTVFILAGLFALFANTINARKDPGAYWEAVMKDEPMPQVIQGLVDDASKVTSPLSPQKNHCNTTPTNSRTFQPTPNLSSYNDDDKLKAQRSFRNDFEPRPSASAYTDASEVKQEKSFVKDFEPRPNLTAYTDKSDAEKDKDFEPRPNSSAYNDNKDMKEENSFTKVFELRPKLSAHKESRRQLKKAIESDLKALWMSTVSVNQEG
ncbi:organ-specific protein P4-like [Sesamum indicum]|uniref:Organ-specific protein P4-like n=1 Tax=Sesamum indicum TaxID=4182 RepID=A0A8M8V6R2_SESIN|nr:organ-specific protein P4-like [Sesamum indicum]